MPKIIELTVEIDIQRVSCPGVWLCQDGRVSLTVFALGTSYQTCLLPPTFPLMFKDVFYFKKRFEETCALNNICCLLKGETIYCELVQWCEDCTSKECLVLAQYLGALNVVLFPPNVCSSDGVDLLMRRSKNFPVNILNEPFFINYFGKHKGNWPMPGILSPKIEIATKVRIDEIWNQMSNLSSSLIKLATCHCTPRDDSNRQKQVCHSARYHKNRCHSQTTRKGKLNSGSRSRSRSRSLSGSNRSCCSLNQKQPTADNDACCCPNPLPPLSPGRRSSAPAPNRLRHCQEYCVYNVQTDSPQKRGIPWNNYEYKDNSDDLSRSSDDQEPPEKIPLNEDRMKKILLESRYIDFDQRHDHLIKDKPIKYYSSNVTPCVCEICKRYHELFHNS